MSSLVSCRVFCGRAASFYMGLQHLFFVFYMCGWHYSKTRVRDTEFDQSSVIHIDLKAAFHDTDRHRHRNPREDPRRLARHAYIESARILARMSVLVSLNAALTKLSWTRVNHPQYRVLNGYGRQLANTIEQSKRRPSYRFYGNLLLGPFHGAIAVPSVTRCRCRRRRRRRRGH